MAAATASGLGSALAPSRIVVVGGDGDRAVVVSTAATMVARRRRRRLWWRWWRLRLRWRCWQLCLRGRRHGVEVGIGLGLGVPVASTSSSAACRASLYGGKVGGLTTADQHRQLETDGATASLADEKGGLPPEPAQPIPRAAGPCSGQAGSPGKAATWRACVDADHASRAASYCSCRRPDFGLRALSSCGAQASMAGFHCI